MFKEKFIRLCNEKGESPSSVCKKVKITPATFSGWDESSIPRQATLLRIADYFGVTVEYLKGEEKEKTPTKVDDFTDDQKRLVGLYNELNAEGREKLIDYADDLVESGKYKKDHTISLGSKTV